MDHGRPALQLGRQLLIARDPAIRIEDGLARHQLRRQFGIGESAVIRFFHGRLGP